MVKRLLSAFAIVFLAACQPSPPEAAAPQSRPKPITLGKATQSTTPRTHQILVTLKEPGDLLVRPGATLTAGDAVADRVRDRQRLSQQLGTLNAQLDYLESQKIPTITLVKPPVPPPPNFQAEEVAIIQAQHELRLTQTQLTVAHERLDQITQLPNIREITLKHERVKVEHAQDAVQTAQLKLKGRQASLEKAQATRQQLEYQAQREAERAYQIFQGQTLQLSRQRQERQFAIAQIQSQIRSAENDLAELETVRTPYSGTIRRIRWGEQSDQSLRATITLDVRDRAIGRDSAHQRPSRSRTGPS